MQLFSSTMKTQTYKSPALRIVSVNGANLMTQSVQTLDSNTELQYGGGSSTDARVKEQGAYNVWDDNWDK